MAVVLDPLDVEERRGIPIDLADEIGNDVVDTVVVVVQTIEGTDSNPAALIDGAPTVVGSLVIVPVRGSIARCGYHLRVKVTTVGGEKIVVPLILHVRKF